MKQDRTNLRKPKRKKKIRIFLSAKSSLANTVRSGMIQHYSELFYGCERCKSNLYTHLRKRKKKCKIYTKNKRTKKKSKEKFSYTN